MAGIYWDVSVHAFDGLTPLPSSLLGRWVSGDVPARKPVNTFMNAYYLDKTGKKYVLKKSITEEQKSEMRKILNEINYRIKSGTKYIDFLKYLINKKVVELKVQKAVLRPPFSIMQCFTCTSFNLPLPESTMWSRLQTWIIASLHINPMKY